MLESYLKKDELLLFNERDLAFFFSFSYLYFLEFFECRYLWAQQVKINQKGTERMLKAIGTNPIITT